MYAGGHDWAPDQAGHSPRVDDVIETQQIAATGTACTRCGYDLDVLGTTAHSVWLQCPRCSHLESRLRSAMTTYEQECRRLGMVARAAGGAAIATEGRA